MFCNAIILHTKRLEEDKVQITAFTHDYGKRVFYNRLWQKSTGLNAGCYGLYTATGRYLEAQEPHYPVLSAAHMRAVGHVLSFLQKCLPLEDPHPHLYHHIESFLKPTNNSIIIQYQRLWGVMFTALGFALDTLPSYIHNFSMPAPTCAYTIRQTMRCIQNHQQHIENELLSLR